MAVPRGDHRSRLIHNRTKTVLKTQPPVWSEFLPPLAAEVEIDLAGRFADWRKDSLIPPRGMRSEFVGILVVADVQPVRHIAGEAFVI